MRVMFFGTYDEDRHPRVRVLRQGLTSHGADVTAVNRPLADSTADRVAAAMNPIAAITWLGRLIQAWAGLLRGSLGQERPEVVIVGYLGVLDVLVARSRWPRAFVVLDHMAPLSGVAEDRGLGKAAGFAFRALDRLAETASNLIIFDTEDNAALSSSAPGKKLVVPVGAPDEWFVAASTPVTDDEPLRVVFFGLHTPLQGTPTIGAAISLLRDSAIEFTMVGSGQDLAECRAAAGDARSVTWIDWVPAHELPELVARHHVCLGIFGTTPKAARVVPNKVYQAGAAGCAIVTRESPAQRTAVGEIAQFVDGGAPASLAAALRALSSDRTKLRRLQDRSRNRAKDWRPESITRELYSRIAEGGG